MSLFIDFPAWISPEIVPGLPVRWYGLMYIVAFFITYALFRYQARRGEIDIDSDDSLSLFLWTIGGLLIGARLFSVLFYDGTTYYWTHPWMIFWPWRNGRFVGLPGMSYHGGLVGAVAGALIFCRLHKKSFFVMADAMVAGIPLGYTFGRIGNFINGELWGRVMTKSWGIVFPDAPSYSTNYQWVRDIADLVGIPYGPGAMVNLPRHPSQLYEALFEGIVLWLVVWFILRPMLKKRFPGFLLSCYLIGYGLIRFVIEYFREPDGNLGFIISLGSVSEPTALFQSFLNISMGQIFCFLMILGGILLYTVARHRFRMSGSPAAGDGKVVRADAKRTGNGYGRQGNHTRKRGH